MEGSLRFPGLSGNEKIFTEKENICTIKIYFKYGQNLVQSHASLAKSFET